MWRSRIKKMSLAGEIPIFRLEVLGHVFSNFSECESERVREYNGG